MKLKKKIFIPEHFSKPVSVKDVEDVNKNIPNNTVSGVKILNHILK